MKRFTFLLVFMLVSSQILMAHEINKDPVGTILAIAYIPLTSGNRKTEVQM